MLLHKLQSQYSAKGTISAPTFWYLHVIIIIYVYLSF